MYWNVILLRVGRGDLSSRSHLSQELAAEKEPVPGGAGVIGYQHSRRNSRYEKPQAGKSLRCWKDGKETNMAGVARANENAESD